MAVPGEFLLFPFGSDGFVSKAKQGKAKQVCVCISARNTIRFFYDWHCMTSGHCFRPGSGGFHLAFSFQYSRQARKSHPHQPEMQHKPSPMRFLHQQIVVVGSPGALSFFGRPTTCCSFPAHPNYCPYFGTEARRHGGDRHFITEYGTADRVAG